MLFYLAGYAQQEIAAIMELPLATVKKRLFHARQRLRQQLDDLVRERSREQQPVDEQFARMCSSSSPCGSAILRRYGRYLDADPALLNAHERWDEATARQLWPADRQLVHCAAPGGVQWR